MEKSRIFLRGGNSRRISAVYFIVVRQMLVPFALLSLVPVTVVIVFAIAIDSPSPSAPKAKNAAEAVSAAAVEES